MGAALAATRCSGAFGAPRQLGRVEEDGDPRRLEFLLLWSIIEAAGPTGFAHQILPTSRISSSALIKTPLTEGIIEDDDYSVLRRGLAVRNAVAHGFLNQPVDAALFEELRKRAKDIVGVGFAVIMSYPSPALRLKTDPEVRRRVNYPGSGR